MEGLEGKSGSTERGKGRLSTEGLTEILGIDRRD